MGGPGHAATPENIVVVDCLFWFFFFFFNLVSLSTTVGIGTPVTSSPAPGKTNPILSFGGTMRRTVCEGYGFFGQKLKLKPMVRSGQ